MVAGCFCLMLTSEKHFPACAPKCYTDTIVLIYGNNRDSTMMCYTRYPFMLYYWSTVADSHAPYCADNQFN